MSRPRRYVRQPWLIALLLILLGAFAFRIWNLGTQSLWHDEAWSVMSSYQPLMPIDPNYPPLFTLFLGIWIRLAGDSVWAMRYFSLLWGVVTVAVVALVSRRWFGPRAGILAAILVAASPPLWVYAQEIRSYVAMPLFAVTLLALAGHLTQDTNRLAGDLSPRLSLTRTWVWLLLVEILALYDHNLAVPLTAWLNVTVLAIWLWRRDWQRAALWIGAQVVLLIAYLPWLLTQKPTGTPLNTPPKIGLGLAWDIWQSYFTGIKALVGADTWLSLLIVLFGFVTVFAAILLLRRRRDRLTLLLLSQVILLPFFELVIILAAHIDFHPRYFLLGVIPTLMMVAAGLVSDSPQKQRRITGSHINRLRPIPTVGAAVLCLATAFQMARVLYSDPKYQHDDFRDLAAYYATLTPLDAIIIPYGWEPTLDYYSRKMSVQARWISVPLHASGATIADRLKNDTINATDVEFPTWFQLPADVRGAYPCLLGTNRLLADAKAFSGTVTQSYSQVYDDGALPEPTPSSLAADFGPVQLLGMEGWSGTEGACVVTHWRLTAQTGQNWSVSVRALNPLGWEVARADSELLSDAQTPTSVWQMGDETTAYALLKLPPSGAGAVSYPVIVSVYNESSPHGLDVTQNGKPQGKDATIGSVSRYLSCGACIVQPAPGARDLGGDLPSGLGGSLYLDHFDAPAGTPQPGQILRITLYWIRLHWTADPLTVNVRLAGDGWATDFPGTLYGANEVVTWHALTIPAQA
ncbi:MAG TPA: glycosyltransferase family 39 protein, partial [Aggregatilineales bacterium]|nr:glycosyltransferase family 39 protein [Aggregatilineales bacterium]